MYEKSKGYKVFNVVNIILMTIVIFICIFPFLYVFSRSLSDSRAILSGKVFLYPVGLNLQGYLMVLLHPGFLKGYVNTIIYTVAGTLISLFMTLICAYPLSKKKVFGINVFMKFMLVTMFLNGGLIPSFVLVSKLGFIDHIWAIILPTAINQFYVILVMAHMQGIPKELEESASLEGLNPISILFRIILPLSKPVFATISLFTIVGIWNEWFTPMIYLFSNEKFPIMLILRNIIAGSDLSLANGIAGSDVHINILETTLKSAAIILTALPIITIYPFVQKYFVKGVMIGSIKF